MPMFGLDTPGSNSRLRRSSGKLAACVGLCMLSFLLGATTAAQLPAPEGPVLLALGGKIALTNSDGVALFDRARLERLPQVTVRTETPWTKGIVEFEGPLLRDLLHLVGARGTVLEAKALDAYTVEIPASDANEHEVILAIRKNGKAMPVRERGPLWIIYPWSDDSGLSKEIYFRRSIWQLESLTVR